MVISHRLKTFLEQCAVVDVKLFVADTMLSFWPAGRTPKELFSNGVDLLQELQDLAKWLISKGVPTRPFPPISLSAGYDDVVAAESAVGVMPVFDDGTFGPLAIECLAGSIPPERRQHIVDVVLVPGLLIIPKSLLAQLAEKDANTQN